MEIFLIAVIVILAVAFIVAAVILVVSVKLFNFAFKNKNYGKTVPVIQDGDSELIKQKKRWIDRQVTEEVSIQSKDGLKLSGFIIRTDKPSGKLVICFHGYTCTGRREFAAFTQFYYENGFDMLIIDQRAHGRSEGKYITYGAFEQYDAQQWVEYANTKFGDNYNIYLHGVSMGAATVLMASALPMKNVKAIIADCGYSSPKAQFDNTLKHMFHLPSFPFIDVAGSICKMKAKWNFSDVDVTAAVAKTDIPILFIHGGKDSFIPMEMSQTNYRACRSKKELLIIDGADHAESYDANVALYEEKFLDFINSVNE